jgi:hypothetical protein
MPDLLITFRPRKLQPKRCTMRATTTIAVLGLSLGYWTSAALSEPASLKSTSNAFVAVKKDSINTFGSGVEKGLKIKGQPVKADSVNRTFKTGDAAAAKTNLDATRAGLANKKVTAPDGSAKTQQLKGSGTNNFANLGFRSPASGKPEFVKQKEFVNSLR